MKNQIEKIKEIFSQKGVKTLDLGVYNDPKVEEWLSSNHEALREEYSQLHPEDTHGVDFEGWSIEKYYIQKEKEGQND